MKGTQFWPVADGLQSTGSAPREMPDQINYVRAESQPHGKCPLKCANHLKRQAKCNCAGDFHVRHWRDRIKAHSLAPAQARSRFGRVAAFAQRLADFIWYPNRPSRELAAAHESLQACLKQVRADMEQMQKSILARQNDHQDSLDAAVESKEGALPTDGQK